ncbi:MAG: hydantoinase/oxoprolinase family protein [Acidimicrobiales bacterium]
MTGYRIGCDVGGTFTDLVCVTPDGEIVLDKTPSTLEDQSIGVMRGIAQLATRFELSLPELCSKLEVVVHGTTTADNTMIEMDGANTGLLVTRGHRDEIEMRRVHKEQIWDPSYPAPRPIARRRARIAIPERCAFDGSVLEALDEAAVRAGIRRLKQLGCTSIAVQYLFSFVNADHELRTRELLAEEYPEAEHVSLSHEVMAAGPEFERVSTTLVNAYVAPRIAKYTTHLLEQLRAAGYRGQVLIMQATGGVMPPEHVVRRAVTLLGSGPTGGVMGSAVAAKAAAAPDFVAIDMGGTSFDICLVRGGRPEVKTDRNWRYRYYIGIPMVDVRSVGAGGGSIARVRQGALLVGPESAGSVPGPACYARGGERPTVTDADAVLGYLPVEGFAGGSMTLDVELARVAIGRDVAEPLGMDVIEAAWGIERIVNAHMADATRRVLASYGADARELAVIAYGGNGPLHACAIAAELGAGRVLVPKAAPAFSALGLLVADYVVDASRSYVTPISQVELQRLRSLMAELVDQADKELAPANLPVGDVRTDLYVLMAYSGQNSDVSVPCPEGATLDDAGLLDLAQRFHDLHESDRGFAFRNQQPQIRGVRLTARGETSKPSHLAEMGNVVDPTTARKGTRVVHWGEGFVDTEIYDGAIVGPGFAVAGPALIEELFTVVAVPPGWRAALGAHASYELTVT